MIFDSADLRSWHTGLEGAVDCKVYSLLDAADAYLILRNLQSTNGKE